MFITSLLSLSFLLPLLSFVLCCCRVLLAWPPCSPHLRPLDLHLWQAWETAPGDRQFTSQLELRAMIVGAISELDPDAAEKACTIGSFTGAWRVPRQKRPFRAPLPMDQLTCTRFFWSRSTRLGTRTKEPNNCASFGVLNLQAP